jgi:hypothetical protein
VGHVLCLAWAQATGHWLTAGNPQLVEETAETANELSSILRLQVGGVQAFACKFNLLLNQLQPVIRRLSVQRLSEWRVFERDRSTAGGRSGGHDPGILGREPGFVLLRLGFNWWFDFRHW